VSDDSININVNVTSTAVGVDDALNSVKNMVKEAKDLVKSINAEIAAVSNRLKELSSAPGIGKASASKINEAIGHLQSGSLQAQSVVSSTIPKNVPDVSKVAGNLTQQLSMIAGALERAGASMSAVGLSQKRRKAESNVANIEKILETFSNMGSGIAGLSKKLSSPSFGASQAEVSSQDVALEQRIANAMANAKATARANAERLGVLAGNYPIPKRPSQSTIKMIESAAEFSASPWYKYQPRNIKDLYKSFEKRPALFQALLPHVGDENRLFEALESIYRLKPISKSWVEAIAGYGNKDFVRAVGTLKEKGDSVSVLNKLKQLHDDVYKEELQRFLKSSGLKATQLTEAQKLDLDRAVLLRLTSPQATESSLAFRGLLDQFTARSQLGFHQRASILHYVQGLPKYADAAQVFRSAVSGRHTRSSGRTPAGDTFSYQHIPDEGHTYTGLSGFPTELDTPVKLPPSPKASPEAIAKFEEMRELNRLASIIAEKSSGSRRRRDTITGDQAVLQSAQQRAEAWRTRQETLAANLELDKLSKSKRLTSKQVAAILGSLPEDRRDYVQSKVDEIVARQNASLKENTESLKNVAKQLEDVKVATKDSAGASKDLSKSIKNVVAQTAGDTDAEQFARPASGGSKSGGPQVARPASGGPRRRKPQVAGAAGAGGETPPPPPPELPSKDVGPYVPYAFLHYKGPIGIGRTAAYPYHRPFSWADMGLRMYHPSYKAGPSPFEAPYTWASLGAHMAREGRLVPLPSPPPQPGFFSRLYGGIAGPLFGVGGGGDGGDGGGPFGRAWGNLKGRWEDTERREAAMTAAGEKLRDIAHGAKTKLRIAAGYHAAYGAVSSASRGVSDIFTQKVATELAPAELLLGAAGIGPAEREFVTDASLAAAARAGGLFGEAKDFMTVYANLKSMRGLSDEYRKAEGLPPVTPEAMMRMVERTMSLAAYGKISPKEAADFAPQVLSVLQKHPQTRERALNDPEGALSHFMAQMQVISRVSPAYAKDILESGKHLFATAATMGIPLEDVMVSVVQAKEMGMKAATSGRMTRQTLLGGAETLAKLYVMGRNRKGAELSHGLLMPKTPGQVTDEQFAWMLKVPYNFFSSSAINAARKKIKPLDRGDIMPGALAKARRDAIHAPLQEFNGKSALEYVTALIKERGYEGAAELVQDYYPLAVMNYGEAGVHELMGDSALTQQFINVLNTGDRPEELKRLKEDIKKPTRADYQRPSDPYVAAYKEFTMANALLGHHISKYMYDKLGVGRALKWYSKNIIDTFDPMASSAKGANVSPPHSDTLDTVLGVAETAANLAGLGSSAVLGAKLGATLGTIGGPIGTFVGGGVGAAGGALTYLVSHYGYSKLLETLFPISPATTKAGIPQPQASEGIPNDPFKDLVPGYTGGNVPDNIPLYEVPPTDENKSKSISEAGATLRENVQYAANNFSDVVTAAAMAFQEAVKFAASMLGSSPITANSKSTGFTPPSPHVPGGPRLV
jgi:hypothetical protein